MVQIGEWAELECPDNELALERPDLGSLLGEASEDRLTSVDDETEEAFESGSYGLRALGRRRGDPDDDFEEDFDDDEEDFDDDYDDDDFDDDLDDDDDDEDDDFFYEDDDD